MTSAAHIIPMPGTIEAERDALRRRDAGLDAGRKALSLDMYHLRQRWGQLYPQGSDRDFVTWFWGSYKGTGYTYLRSGYAQTHGAPADRWRNSELSAIGHAMLDGDSYPDIVARIQAGLPARRPQRDVTTLQIPSVEAPAIRAAVASVSETDKLNGPEAAARIFSSYGLAPKLLQDGLRRMDSTGAALIPALVDAVDTRKDYRAALKRQPCVMCGATSGIHLHHQKVEADERNRSHEYLMPVCEACHIARPGDDHGIHASKFEELRQDPDFWRRAFIALSNAAEASRPERSTP